MHRLIGFVLAIASVAVVAAQQPARRDALELYRNGRYAAAVEVTLAEIEENTANLDAYTVLGWSLNALQRYEDALSYGQQGLSISRFDHRIIQIVGEAHYQLENRIESLQYFEDYAAIAPNGSFIDEVYFLMGDVLYGLEEYHRADIALTNAVLLADQRGKPRATWWELLGQARESGGSTGAAREAYTRAVQLNPNARQAVAALARLRPTAPRPQRAAPQQPAPRSQPAAPGSQQPEASPSQQPAPQPRQTAPRAQPAPRVQPTAPQSQQPAPRVQPTAPQSQQSAP